MERNKKKIIRVTTIPSSLKIFCEGMLKELSEAYDVVAISSPGADLDLVREREGVRTIAVPMERHISLWRDFMSLIKMIGVFRKEKPYMVHSMTPKAGMVSMLSGLLTGVPVRVHTFTGLVWPTSKGLKRRILMCTDWLTCACATHVIPEGQGVLNDLRAHITSKPMKVLGYGNIKGVDMRLFDRTRLSNVKKDDSKFTFMFVGRIVGDKGINELIEAFTKLHDKYPQTRLNLVGKYEEKLDPLKQITIDRMNSNPAIVFAGAKYGDDLIKEYLVADCHIMPSYREGFPNTPIEAGALGLPNIVTDINGSREIVINEENGLVVPPRDAKALYDAMERMLTDKALREKIEKNARPMIESRFEKSFVRKCLYDFYDEIM